MARPRALVVGLTGGIGAGKSAALERFAELGAIVIDSDDVARRVVEPDAEGFAAVVERFGAGIVGVDGSLDRARLGSLVFADAAARADLEAIVHPLVRARVRDVIAAATPDDVVVNEVPLLVEAGLAGEYDLVIVVEAPLDLRLHRLAARGMSRDDALARIASQASDDERRAVAWKIVANDGTLMELRDRVDAVWQVLVGGSNS
jgi:dephospho-CoA kinase